MGDSFKPALHGRDHCPGGTDPIPCMNVNIFRAIYFNTTGITGITGTNKNLDWSIWQTGDPTIFAPKTSADADPTPGTDLVRYVYLMKKGRYFFNVGVRLEDNVLGFKISLNDNDAPFGFGEDIWSGPQSAYSTTGWLIFSFARIYPMIDPFDSEFFDELREWPVTISEDDPLPIFFTMAANIATSTEVKQAFLEITHETVVFPTSTEWPTT